MKQEEVARLVGDQAAHDELIKQATTPPDKKYLAQVQEELDRSREELGKDPTRLATMPDGSVIPEHEAKALYEDGQAGHPYGDKGRRA